MSRRAALTFSESYSKWFQLHAKPYLRDLQTPTSLYRRYLAPTIGQRKMSTITRLELQQLHAQIGSSAGHTSANRALELVRAVFNKMIDWDLFDGNNPALRIKRFRLRSRERFLQPDEVGPFLAACDRLSSTTARDFFKLLLWTGARKSELLSMQWSHINWALQVWEVPETKGGDAQSKILVDLAAELLRERAETSTSQYVFPGPRGHYLKPYEAWRRVCADAGIEGLRIHDLRRSLASWEAMTGASTPIIGKSLGHMNAASTAVYARLNHDPVRAAMEKAVGALRGQAKR